MQSNLVLTTVMDKNGVMTKRWVKPPVAMNGAATPALPPLRSLNTPVSLEGISTSALQKELYMAFSSYGDRDEFDIDDIEPIIKRSEDHTLRLLTNFIQQNGRIDHDRVTIAADLLRAYDYDKIALNEVLYYYDAFSGGAYLEFREEAVKKLHKCAEIPDAEDYSLADEDTQVEARRLLKSAEEYYADTYDPDDSSHNIILGEEMRKFLRSNMKRIERIDEIMIERDTEDPVLVNSILNSETPSISSGIL